MIKLVIALCLATSQSFALPVSAVYFGKTPQNTGCYAAIKMNKKKVQYVKFFHSGHLVADFYGIEKVVNTNQMDLYKGFLNKNGQPIGLLRFENAANEIRIPGMQVAVAGMAITCINMMPIRQYPL